MADLGDLTPPRSAEVGESTTFTWHGKQFRVAPVVPFMAVVRFASVAARGGDTDDMSALAAMHDLLTAGIHQDDVQAFTDHAIRVSASDDDLLAVAGAVIAAASERPTGRPSDSPGGSQPTEPPYVAV